MSHTEPSCRNCGVPVIDSTGWPSQSPVSALLGTNAFPFPGEALHIRKTVNALESSLSTVEAEMARMQAVMENLSRKRTELSKSLKDHRDLLSPIRRLPPEMLSKIFIHCLTDDPRPRADRAPLLLGRVCHAWRLISHSTPQLWSSIAVKILEYQARPVHFRDWVGRSGALPLTMTISGNYCDAITDILSSCAPRIEHMYLSPDLLALHSLAWPQCGFPSLRRLELELYRLVREPDAGSPGLFADCPQLRDVDIKYRLRDVSFSALPWHQLTRLTAQLGSVKDFLNVLEWSPSLQEYTVDDIATLTDPALRSPAAFQTAVREHKSLISLHILASNPYAVSHLFDHLALPSLQVCTITNSSSWHFAFAFPVAPFLSLLARSRCGLQALRLDDVHLPEADFTRCLARLPALRKLEVHGGPGRGAGCDYITDAVMESLRGGEVCPRLQTLVLHDVHADPLLVKQFAEMVRSRFRVADAGTSAPVPLVRVDLNLTGAEDSIADEEVRPLRALREECLDISVSLRTRDYRKCEWRTKTVV